MSVSTLEQGVTIYLYTVNIDIAFGGGVAWKWEIQLTYAERKTTNSFLLTQPQLSTMVLPSLLILSSHQLC